MKNERIFSFALGNIWRWSSSENRNTLIDYIRDLEISGVELTFATKEDIYSFRLSSKNIDPEQPDGQPAYYNVYGTIDAKQRKIHVKFAAPSVDASEVGGKVKFTHCDGSTHTETPDMIVLDIVLNTFSMQMDGSYNIQSGHKTGTTVMGFDVYHEGSIEWENISADAAPTDSTHAMAPGSFNADLLSDSILCRHLFGNLIV